MLTLHKGRYAARMADSDADMARVLAMRAQAFRGTGNAEADRDGLDARCRHVMVEDTATGDAVCAFRVLALQDGRDIGISYSAQYYDLASLRQYERRMLEVGRFCLSGDAHDPDILRVAFGALTRHVGETGVGMLFGCSSFAGVDPHAYRDAFALLCDHYVAPRRWQPRVKAPNVVRFDPVYAGIAVDPIRAARTMPPLLRTYLSLGAWVSDHAVVDHDMGTLHVFTAVEIGKVPDRRAQMLRAIAG